MKKTLVQFLMESDFDDEEFYHPTHSPLLTLCGHFIRQCVEPLSQGKFLVRGMGHLNVDNVVKQVQRNRIPVNSPVALHNIINDAFEENYGEKYRSEAVFASKHSGNTYYGTRYAIFPIGKYSAVYSPSIDDLYDLIVAGLRDVPKSYPVLNGITDRFANTVLHRYLSTDEIYGLIDNARITPSKYTPEFLALIQAIIADSSLGSFTYNLDLLDTDKNQNLVEDVLNELIKLNYLKTSNLHDYLQDTSLRANEVMIKCNSYIAVNVERPAKREKLIEFLKGIHHDLSSAESESSSTGG